MFRYVIIPPLSFLLFTACFLEGFKKKKKKATLAKFLKKNSPLKLSPITHCSPRSILPLQTSVHTDFSFPEIRVSLKTFKRYSSIRHPLSQKIIYWIAMKYLYFTNLSKIYLYIQKKKTRLIIKSYVRLKRWKNKRALLHVCRIKARKKFKEKLKKNEHDEATC